MQSKPNTINHIYGVWPILRHKILLTPRRSYAELQQALQQAEKVTEHTLGELLALRQSQQLGNPSDTTDQQQMQQQHIQFMIKQVQRQGSGFAMLFVQLDNYQEISVNYGAATAKQVSELAMTRLAEAVRECDVVSQQADDKFLLLITNVSRIYDAVLVAEKLMQKLALLNGLCQPPLELSASIGISRCPEDGIDAELLMEKAAAAMLHAQSRGGNQFSLLR
jgi:diguanylate cyclase (GGDEF)-like protein